jgi:hypothetical protein
MPNDQQWPGSDNEIIKVTVSDPFWYLCDMAPGCRCSHLRIDNPPKYKVLPLDGGRAVLDVLSEDLKKEKQTLTFEPIDGANAIAEAMRFAERLSRTRNVDSDSEFEQGRLLGHAQEQHRLERCLHDRLGPEILELAFEIEFISAQLRADGHPAEPKLREVQNRLSEILAAIHQAILSDGGKA